MQRPHRAILKNGLADSTCVAFTAVLSCPCFFQHPPISAEYVILPPLCASQVPDEEPGSLWMEGTLFQRLRDGCRSITLQTRTPHRCAVVKVRALWRGLAVSHDQSKTVTMLRGADVFSMRRRCLGARYGRIVARTTFALW